MRLILVSQSPRRKMLLKQKGYHFYTDSVKVSEFIDKNLNLEDAIRAISRQKAEAYLKSSKGLKNEDFLLLTADTVVVFQGQVLGKPKNSKEAMEFLTLLSGREHEVWTAICFYHSKDQTFVEGLEKTKIRFHSLSESQKQEYVQTGDSLDKAGGYGIQNVKENFVKTLTGSYSNVVGLPMGLVEKIIKENGWRLDS